MNHPIPPGPHGAVSVILIAMAVSIPRNIHPLDSHFFSIMFACQQFIHYFFIRVDGFILQKFFLLFDRWR